MKSDKKNSKKNIEALIDFCSVIAGEKIKGKGEDSYLLDIIGNKVVQAVFDGCGGAGARVYPEFGSRSGAYIASRVVAEATLSAVEKGRFSSLEADVRTVLQDYNRKTESENVLHGSIVKDFPTTMSGVIIESRKPETLSLTLMNAGDSRCYVLSSEGLMQLTKDDLVSQDAFQSLYDSAPMTNVLYASDKCKLNITKIEVRLPVIVFAATDGCFDYFRSPMEFELTLLETMKKARNACEWENNISSVLDKTAGDDFTMVLSAIGFKTFAGMKKILKPRYDEIKGQYDLKTSDTEKLRSMWEHYRRSYERF